MELYRNIDIQAITDSLDKIIEKTIIIRNDVLEPNIKEYLEVMEIIKNFIRDKKRIVYGGNAYNALIGAKNEDDKIYKHYDRKDIEFYTYDPIDDLVKLCNLLHDKGFQYVQGSQAQHEGTYSIFVNFSNVCDITYMPKNIYSNMPVVNIDKILYSDPLWILIDILRQYNDPILSYWRLKDKTFFRANVLLKYYPLKLQNKHSFKIKNKYENHKKKLFDIISRMETIIFTGSIAQSYYLTLKSNINVSLIEIFTTKFDSDVKIINKYIEEILGEDYKNIKINLYKPFYQFWDQRVEFFIGDECIIKIFGNNQICLPYNNLYLQKNKISKIQVGGFYKKIIDGNNETPIKIATFILLFNHYLIHRHYEYVNRLENYKKYETIMYNLLVKRNEYLEKEHKNVTDNIPYKEFIIRCSGEVTDTNRRYRLKLTDKKQKGKNLVFKYFPETQKNNYNPPEFKFQNISGNLNVNDKKLLF